MVLFQRILTNFYPLFSVLFLFFGRSKKENEVQAPAESGMPLPVPKGVKSPLDEQDKPIFRIEQPTIPALPELKDPKTINIRYPLIPPYAFARIRWDNEATELIYEIEEPQLTEKENKTLEILEDGIKELINLSFISVKDRDTVLLYLEKNIRVLLTELSIDLDIESYLKIMYYIY